MASEHLRMLASSSGHSQILSRSCGVNREKAWDQNYIMDREWWTRLVQTESIISDCSSSVLAAGQLGCYNALIGPNMQLKQHSSIVQFFIKC